MGPPPLSSTVPIFILSSLPEPGVCSLSDNCNMLLVLGTYRYFEKQKRASPRFIQLYKGSNIRTFAPTSEFTSERLPADSKYVLSLQNLRAGRYYTLLTHSFIHFGFRHLLANMSSFFGSRSTRRHTALWHSTIPVTLDSLFGSWWSIDSQTLGQG